MRTLGLLILLFIWTNATWAQTDCRPYVPTEEGTQWEITNYDKKGKPTGKIAYELMEKEVAGNTITFTIKSITYDKKDEEVYTNTFTAKCEDGKFDFNMAFKMDGSSMQAYQNMNVDIDASDLEIPAMDETVGTNLKDGSLKMNINTGNALNLNMTVFVTDRKIEAKEKTTTSAGDFDCIVLSQNVSTKFLFKMEGASKEWYAPEVGMVRSESYNKKGKLTGYSELTKLEK